ncbi:MAG: class I SAM-dependent methyltransferase [Planctomycetes bacterium]|nr:class I SAM-dependent methyltransferase [Planctomycetota bacterium]MCW8134216.1 class I SAM-dependent methyltransferase [Planctomycetota bacterium]
MDEPWYIRAFAAEYLELYRHRSPAQGRQQVQQMLASGLLPRAGRVLDLCCGAGRHLLPMRDAGLKACGLDLSQQLLHAGRLAGVAVRADARVIPFADASFDCVTNLFSSFGYFPDDAAHHAVLAEVARVLRPDGRLVLDHMNAQVTIRELEPLSVEKRDGLTLRQTRRFDTASRRVIKEVEYIPDGLPPRHWHESVRLFEPAELDGFIEAAGLTVTARHGDLDASVFKESTSNRQVVVARKGDST